MISTTNTLSAGAGLSNFALIKKAESCHSLTKEEIIKLLEDNSINNNLFNAADNVRKQFVGDDVHLRALIEFSNICKCNCKYCGIRKDNNCIERYRITEEEIISLAKLAKDLDYKTVVLQSGEDAFFSTEKLCKIIEQIKKLNLAVTLSIGEKTYQEYKSYKEAGADRYLLRIETTNRNLYEQMHPNMSFENRINCLNNLKELGYETGTGCLVGLPLQTVDSLAEDILFFKKLNADMVGLGPFIPAPNTPLQNVQGGDLTLALKVMAITRLLLPDINIPATTAMETLHPDGRIFALKSGANVVMPNITNINYKKKYTIYPGKAGENISAESHKKTVVDKIESIGRNISQNYGFRTKV